MGLVSKTLGRGIDFENEGKTYKISSWTFGVQAKYEEYLESNALKTLSRMRTQLDQMDYQEYKQDILDKVATRYYTFGSKVVAESLRSNTNLKWILMYSLQVYDKTIGMDFINSLSEEKLDEAIYLMFTINQDTQEVDPSKPKSEENGPSTS
jgi:hypothetical protein